MYAFANPLITVALALLSVVQSQPFPGVATAGSSANAGAFSSSGTSLRPGPDGTGSFIAQSGLSQDFSNPSFRSAVSSSPQGFAGGYAGGYTGGSFGSTGGYSGGSLGSTGGYSGGSFGSTGFAPFPNFAPIPFPYFAPNQPFDFSSFFQNYLASLQRYHQQLAASAQKAAADQGAQAPQFPQSPDSFGNELGGAAAFGQYGPQGGYGGAGVFPAPADSSVDNRFGGPVAQSSGPFPPPNGSNFYGVSSFSSSGQSDVNGKKSSFKQSKVTVNDNGKVTTYQAHDP